jgi:hypothetical protein
VKRFSPAVAIAVVVAFGGGFSTHFLYQRWNSPDTLGNSPATSHRAQQGLGLEPQSHRVTFAPLPTPAEILPEPPLLQARDVDKLRAIAGSQVRIRGRIFRVGHSAKSNTYFLNFGPSREALTGVIFASAVESFVQGTLPPKGYEGKEVEIVGIVKDHPQFGLEVVLENPTQIRVIN